MAVIVTPNADLIQVEATKQVKTANQQSCEDKGI
jgi:hypothetical protein